MTRLAYLTLFLFLCLGCAASNIISTVTLPGGDTYKVSSKSDSVVEFQNGDKKILVDNRGRPGLIEQVLTMGIVNLPDVDIGTNGGN